MSERGMNWLSERDDASIAVALHALDSGGQLFVINLCASMTPVQVDQKTLPGGLDRYKLYQVSRMEDGRRRYRLRLGFFHTESAAEDVLVAVRSQFATAFATCLCNEDLKSASIFLKRPLNDLQHEFDTQRTGRFKVLRPMEPNTPIQPAPIQSAKHSFADAKKSLDQQLDALIDKQLSVASHPQNKSRTELTAQLTASTPPMAVSPQRAQSNSHFHVGSGVDIPDFGITLTADSPTTAASPATKQAVQAGPAKAASTKAAPVNEAASFPLTPLVPKAPPVAQPSPARVHVAQPQVVATAPVKTAVVAPSNGWRQESVDDGIPTLDTTQTIRALTAQELQDASAAKWFVVQLALSDHAVNLDTMPHLDIFEAYTLYSVAMMDGGGIRYALRLGFFSEEVSAQAVMGYLRTFFGSPSIERISGAEHQRFSSPPEKPAPMPAQASPSALPQSNQTKAGVVALDAKRPVAAPLAVPSMATRPTPVVAAKPVAKPTVTNAPAPAPVQQKAAPVKPAPVSSPTVQYNRPPQRQVAPSPEVSMPAIKPMVTMRITGKYAAPAVRHARQGTGNTNVPMERTGPSTKPSNTQRDLLDDAAFLGLSDTQILRAKANPSLLSRLVGKLTR